jgi:UDP-glucose 4-epimerase
MRILITGINGFIGQHLGRALVKREHQVLGLGRDKQCVVKGVRAYYSGSILDKKLVEKTVRDAQVVVHLAALTSHKDIVEKKFETLKTNLLGTENVLDFFSRSKQTRKFLYVSTGKVYGKIARLPISEDHPTNPLNILGKSKLITEKLIDFYNDNQKEFVIFRIFNVYGPGQKENFLIPTVLKQLEEGNKLVLGDMVAKRDYIHIDDVVSAFIYAIEEKGSRGLSIYNICTGKSSSAREIVNLMNKIKSIKIKVKSDSKKIRRDEMRDEYGSYEKAKRDLGWVPKISLTEGLARLIAQYK